MVLGGPALGLVWAGLPKSVAPQCGYYIPLGLYGAICPSPRVLRRAAAVGTISRVPSVEECGSFVIVSQR